MTQEETERKYKIVINEIHNIELTNDKTKRQRWRELQKIKKWLESEIRNFAIKYIAPNM
jgi:hypothetical protein